MLHDLSLHWGIPVTELRGRLLSSELNAWLAYQDLYGSLDALRRIDKAMGLVAYVVHASAGGKMSYDRFVPQLGLAEEWDGMTEADRNLLRAFGPSDRKH